MRMPLATLCALLGLLALAGSSGAAGRVGVGKMTVTPNKVAAGSTGNELIFTFLADSAALSGQTLVDVPRGWTPPQRTNPSGNGYIELQPAGCTSATRITAIVGRRIAIATECQRRHLYRLLYHHASAALLSADGYVFLTQTRPASASKKVLFKPLGPHKQPVVRVHGAAAARLFMTETSIATAGAPFGVTVRAIDAFGNNAADYTGTVTLTSTDPAAALPGPYPYGPKDTAQHTFTGVILRTPGTQRITATDSNGFTIDSGPITVSPFSNTP
ncbi:MAG: hypothetical protein M3R39_06350 [Actinomycetota bacterium]|nr:hypothetical protein [Actinomycetota bacterium]